MSEALAKAVLETFVSVVGHKLEVIDSATGTALTALKLTSAEPLPHGQPGNREPFSLTFEGPDSVSLGQGTYVMRHPAIEDELPIFIVPIAERDHTRRYQAIFS